MRQLVLSLLFVSITFTDSDIGISSKSNKTVPVIGNSNYQFLPLRNPVHNTNDMALVFKNKGYGAILQTNTTKCPSELSLTKVTLEVRKDILHGSENEQTPFDVSSLIVSQSQPTSHKLEEELWNKIKGSMIIGKFEDYLSANPCGRFISLAKLKIRQLSRIQKK
ncbi:MAG: hypothetical protein HOD92_26270 [Deltaproteobacteria bacterium]|jgi:hypothetical protein|nr:hypothetical protein [Deltaproteobacteria bacterium]MBT4527442.1 hypothetical protein [Deltaproteobacteria bacterium]